jgi:catechol 2,3-dioxygenase-like lactoylglutathione lyase family enzyme
LARDRPRIRERLKRFAQEVGSTRAKTPSPLFLAQGWIHIAFSVSDPDTAYEFLQAAGTDVKGMRGKNGKMGTPVLHDPEGNEIELFSR